MAEPVDVSKKHFYISLVKSVVRIAAGGALVYAGYMGGFAYAPLLWAGWLLIGAEILGIAEEL
jgi:hypothetical protein